MGAFREFVLFVAFLCWFIWIPVSNAANAGPYDILFRHFEECPNPGTKELTMTFKVRKYNRTLTLIDANMTLLTDLSDDVSVTIALSQFTNGGYKNNFLYYKFTEACTGSLKIGPIIQDIYKAAKFGGCPIKKGFYSVNNFTSRNTVDILPVFFYNKYRGEVTFYKFNKIIGCLIGYVEFLPKQSKKSVRGG